MIETLIMPCGDACCVGDVGVFLQFLRFLKMNDRRIGMAFDIHILTEN